VIAPLPPAPFGAILADPPWLFLMHGETGDSRNPEYPMMTEAEIAAVPVAPAAAPDCALFLWATGPHLDQSLRVMAAWGFAYKSIAFSWLKVNMDGRPFVGLGPWTRANVELCLLGTRGHPKRLNADVPQAIIERRREHSRKPDCVRQRIQRLVAGPYLELFARSPARGWTAWGNETEKFAAVTDIDHAVRTGEPNLFTLAEASA